MSVWSFEDHWKFLTRHEFWQPSLYVENVVSFLEPVAYVSKQLKKSRQKHVFKNWNVKLADHAFHEFQLKSEQAKMLSTVRPYFPFWQLALST